MDLLSPEQFEEGFGSHTPMITGQTRVVRYYPMFARAFPLMRQLINEQCNLSESSKDTISRATSCKDLYDVMRRDFWVVTSCESTSNPGTAHEGTRITLQVRRLHHSRERERDRQTNVPCLLVSRSLASFSIRPQKATSSRSELLALQVDGLSTTRSSSLFGISSTKKPSSPTAISNASAS